MDGERDFGVVIPAAGSGTRFARGGGAGDKLLVDLCGRTVLQRAVGLFAGHPAVGAIVVVTGAERMAAYEEHLRGVVGAAPLTVVEGGAERWQSVMRGLAALKGVRFVAVHDAARPLTGRGVIDGAFAGAREGGGVGGALPCVAEPATLKRRGADGCVSETVDRRGLFQAQTPQCFELRRLIEGYERLAADVASGRLAAADVTDDAQVFERLGWAVRMTEGAAENLKITTAGDAALARALLGG
ncbi:MAG TPA: 2-C-methyl-D-erythritol 4-phosphate cytidylyltransferase [Phycisphaerae bacterium]|nr:2-C-methyl-D-erythritol 4-phosphate cytidylyltransferase [Phycisphaerae bacterium]